MWPWKQPPASGPWFLWKASKTAIRIILLLFLGTFSSFLLRTICTLWLHTARTSCTCCVLIHSRCTYNFRHRVESNGCLTDKLGERCLRISESSIRTCLEWQTARGWTLKAGCKSDIAIACCFYWDSFAIRSFDFRTSWFQSHFWHIRFGCSIGTSGLQVFFRWKRRHFSHGFGGQKLGGSSANIKIQSCCIWLNYYDILGLKIGVSNQELR